MVLVGYLSCSVEARFGSVRMYNVHVTLLVLLWLYRRYPHGKHRGLLPICMLLWDSFALVHCLALAVWCWLRCCRYCLSDTSHCRLLAIGHICQACEAVGVVCQRRWWHCPLSAALLTFDKILPAQQLRGCMLCCRCAFWGRYAAVPFGADTLQGGWPVQVLKLGQATPVFLLLLIYNFLCMLARMQFWDTLCLKLISSVWCFAGAMTPVCWRGGPTCHCLGGQGITRCNRSMI